MPVGLYTGAQTSIGNAVTTAFPYGWKILDQTHVQVKVDGVLQVLGAHYTVDGVGSSAGGNVNFLVAPANGAVVQRARVVPYKRDVDYQNNGDFKADTVDGDLDIEEMQIQQIAADIARAFKAPLSVTADQVLTDAQWAARASMMLGFDAGGNFGVFAGVNTALVSAFMAGVLTSIDAPTAAAAIGAIAKAIGTTKGDTIGFSGASTPVRVPVGADGFTKRANSSNALGLAWEAPTVAIATGRNMVGRTNATNPNSQCDFTADEIVTKNASGGARIESSVSASADITQAGASGLDTGAEAGNNWYYQWVVSKLNPYNGQAVTADPATDRITLNAHGLSANCPVKFGGGGAPAGLVAGTTYFVRDVTANDFKVAATVNGAAIDITSAGAAVTLTELAALMLSVSATAPTMPAGYTFKALVGAVRNDGGSNFIKYRQFGSRVWYEDKQAALTAGAATVETAISTATWVPPIASEVKFHAQATINSSGTPASVSLTIRAITAIDLLPIKAQTDASSAYNSVVADFPNLSQNLFYILASGGGAASKTADLWILGFKLPMGGE